MSGQSGPHSPFFASFAVFDLYALFRSMEFDLRKQPFKSPRPQRGSGWPERLAALQTAGFMARRNKPTKGAHALGGEIAVVRFHPEQLPQRGRHEGTPASNTAKKGVRKGCHRQTSGLSDRCPSGQSGMLVRGKPNDNAACPNRLGCHVTYPRNNEDDRSGPAVLCKIARFLWESRPEPQPECEQFRSAIRWWQGHH